MKAGKYQARAIGMAFGQTTKGSDYVRVHLKVKVGTEVETISWDGFFTEKTETRTIESLRLLGCTMPGDDITRSDGLGSKIAEVVIEEEVNAQGMPEAKVRWINDTHRAPAVVLDSSGKAQLAARLKSAVITSRVATGQTRQATPKPANGERPPTREAHDAADSEGQDEIPF